jgi:hypothetical protein
MKPNSPKKASAIEALAAVKRGLRNRRTSSIGSGRRAWCPANTARMASDPVMPPRVAADPQPCRGASMIDQVSTAIPTADRRAPSGSNRPAFGSRDSAIMFEDAVSREREEAHPDEVTEQAAAAFAALVRVVEFAAASGAISAPEPSEVAQQLWNSAHGAVALELKGLILTPDPAATYEASLETLIRGLATA